MTVEYRRFLSEHVIYTQKILLQSQLESLMSMKHLHAYKSLRNEELLHKIKLKTLIEQAKHEVDLLIKNLPAPPHDEEEIIPSSMPDKKKSALENELDAIKAKLARLQ